MSFESHTHDASHAVKVVGGVWDLNNIIVHCAVRKEGDHKVSRSKFPDRKTS